MPTLILSLIQGILHHDIRLAKIGEEPQRSFFTMFVYTHSHRNAIEAVAMKLVDGASVDSYIWEFANITNSGLHLPNKDHRKGACLSPLHLL